ncbi:MAG: CPBP family intramembrane metalloprotease [Deltaproteobacteria bacterium]|nr:CPBP family intramembrane metalloprotease [Deltaproteobacteria bacterium]
MSARSRRAQAEAATHAVPAPAARGLAGKLAELHPRRFFLETWTGINAETLARPAPDARPGKRGRAAEAAALFDPRVLVVLVTVAVSLTLMEYFGDRTTFRDLFSGIISRRDRYFELWSFAYWSACRVIGYVAIPCVVVAFMRGERLRDHGMATEGFFRHLWIYVVLYSIVLPTIVLVSFLGDFKSYYPFYDEAGRSWFDFFAWECVYGVQFLSLEFFFRGFILQSLKRTLGAYSIFVMVVPYCMIHFGKPFLEALAAIIAGIVLGTLALKTRSIWCGVLIHVSVAVTMDVAALWQRGALPH